MSETIILIMTSSSTRNTEPRGGRVAVMRYQSLPNRMVRFAKFATGRNIYIVSPPSDRLRIPVSNRFIWSGRQRPAIMGGSNAGTGTGGKCSLSHRRILHQMLGDRRFADPTRRG